MLSIVINNYNYAAFVGDAIDSALSQTYSDREVIVVDDGSSDGSVDVIRSYGKSVKAVFKDNGGQASAFNAGFAECKGDWILFLDADDFLHESAVAVLIEAVEEQATHPIAVQHRLVMVDASGVPLVPEQRNPGRLTERNHLHEILANGSYRASPTSGNLFHRDFLSQVLPMPEAGWRICADLYLQVALPFYGEILPLNECRIGFYRIHEDNHFARRPQKLEEKKKVLKRFLINERRKLVLVRELAARHGRRTGCFFGRTNGTLLFRRICAKRITGFETPFHGDRVGLLLLFQFLVILRSSFRKGFMRNIQLFYRSLLVVFCFRKIGQNQLSFWIGFDRK